MTLDQYANIAELIGLAIVVVTIVFLALQIQQNTKALKAAAIQETLRAELDVAALLIANAETWDKILTAAEFEEGVELRQAIFLYNVFMIDTENRYHQFHSGYLTSQSWDARRNTLPRVVALPVFKQWRTSIGGMSHSADFLELLDSLAARRESV
ncbi:MAG TPA: hypothetical protein VIV14_13765 [Gammaproteobacteria bacterium]